VQVEDVRVQVEDAGVQGEQVINALYLHVARWPKKHRSYLYLACLGVLGVLGALALNIRPACAAAAFAGHVRCAEPPSPPNHTQRPPWQLVLLLHSHSQWYPDCRFARTAFARSSFGMSCLWHA
jgi:hypothetical protein